MSELRILFVDDSEDDVFFAERSLRRAGIELSSCRVWNEAALHEALSEWSPTVVVCDVYLPGFDARRAFEIAHHLAPSVPFLLRSGGVRGRIASEVLAKGAVGYVEKSDDASLIAKILELTAEVPIVAPPDYDAGPRPNRP